jgi:hypothetical protein
VGGHAKSKKKDMVNISRVRNSVCEGKGGARPKRGGVICLT